MKQKTYDMVSIYPKLIHKFDNNMFNKNLKTVKIESLHLTNEQVNDIVGPDVTDIILRNCIVEGSDKQENIEFISVQGSAQILTKEIFTDLKQVQIISNDDGSTHEVIAHLLSNYGHKI